MKKKVCTVLQNANLLHGELSIIFMFDNIYISRKTLSFVQKRMLQVKHNHCLTEINRTCTETIEKRLPQENQKRNTTTKQWFIC